MYFYARMRVKDGFVMAVLYFLFSDITSAGSKTGRTFFSSLTSVPISRLIGSRNDWQPTGGGQSDTPDPMRSGFLISGQNTLFWRWGPVRSLEVDSCQAACRPECVKRSHRINRSKTTRGGPIRGSGMSCFHSLCTSHSHFKQSTVALLLFHLPPTLATVFLFSFSKQEDWSVAQHDNDAIGSRATRLFNQNPNCCSLSLLSKKRFIPQWK